mmetsp:Transcript_488/g.1193  ORF Transcript_488/g.1193 Transcript_488/m.1193 type:complete len:547 (-) Transcript_488:378-2018(-)
MAGLLFLVVLVCVLTSRAQGKVIVRPKGSNLKTNLDWSQPLPANVPFPLPVEVYKGSTTVYIDAPSFQWDVKSCGNAKGHANAVKSCPLLGNALQRYTGLTFPHPLEGNGSCLKPCLNKATIIVQNDSEENGLTTDESYELKVTKSEIQLKATTVFGAMHGLETLSQLVHFNFDSKMYMIENADWLIKDRPEFPHRELLVDSSRHYIPLPILRRIIQGMSYTKVNVLHWHLVDDQSFPWCSEAVPEMCKGAYNRDDRYTKADLKGIVEFARQYGIRVVPELDVPGHSSSWCIGRPDICTAKGEIISPAGGRAMNVVSLLMDEMHEIFPDAFIHLGGDEVQQAKWSKDPNAMAYVHEHNMSSAKEIYLEFVNKAHEKAEQLGKTHIGWEEIYINFKTKLPKSTIIHGWWHIEGIIEASSKGYNCLHSNIGMWYFDQQTTYSQARLKDPCERLGKGCSYLLGGGGAAWAEKVDSSVIFQSIWPRLSGIAESLWSPRDSAYLIVERARQFRCHLNRRDIPSAPIPFDKEIRGKPSLRPELLGPGGCLHQ